jgi:hypothetical protein
VTAQATGSPTGTGTPEAQGPPSQAQGSATQPGPAGGAAESVSSAAPATPDGVPSSAGGRKASPSPSGSQTSGTSRNRPRSPAEAARVATDFQKQSQDAVAEKKFGEAFSLAVKAWQAADAYPNDATCRDLAVKLKRKMNELAAKANAQQQTELDQNPTLIVK